MDKNLWLHEIKLDGYRMQAHLRDGLAQLFTRSKLNWSHYFPQLLKALEELGVDNAIFDGEIVALDELGRSSFQLLQNQLKTKSGHGLRYYIFDLLYLNGKDLRKLPLIERKEILKSVLKKSSNNVMYNEHVLNHGDEFFKVSCEHKIEGVVSKRIDSTYLSGRSDLWLKSKCQLRQEFVVGGYTKGTDNRNGFGALLLGLNEKGSLRYVGKVGSGFNQKNIETIYKKLKKINQNKNPFKLNPPRAQSHWVKPLLVVEVKFAAWTQGGLLRSPVFISLREDKPHQEIVRENPITSPHKIIFKQEKISKQEVSDYYQEVSKIMLSYLAERPLSLVRCPEGTHRSCFFQKHLSGKVPDSIYVGKDHFISIDSAAGLGELVQLNAFEIHAWGCQSGDTHHPDQIVLDLDPGVGVKWSQVVKAAFELKQLLKDYGLESFVKLTGGKGLHLHVPIMAVYNWNEVKNFARSVAQEMVDRDPATYTIKMSKKFRHHKIFIDYLRNGFGATAVAPYSLRAHHISSVALPLSWEELKKVKGPQVFDLKRALKKIRKRQIDPWKSMYSFHQKIKVLEPSHEK